MRNAVPLFLILSVLAIMLVAGCTFTAPSTEQPSVQQVVPSCTPIWDCSMWSPCISGTQTRNCQDYNRCGVTTNKPSVTQSCCEENWACTSYGSCTSSGVQYRTCTDLNYCGTTVNKPSESMSCAISQPEQILWNSKTYYYTEPYYGNYCDKIDQYDSSVRQALAEATINHPMNGTTADIYQLFDIYDWVRKNIVYQTSPLAGIPYSPSQTLATRTGDCKNQAVLIASMVEALGAEARVIADIECKHAYAMVRFGPTDMNMTSYTQAIAIHYGYNKSIKYSRNDEGVWVIFDPAGGTYPGDTLEACYGSKTVYEIRTCVECANLYPNTPYTYVDHCYSHCPSDTITASQYACENCQEGLQACNNQCLRCIDPNQYLATDCRCYDRYAGTPWG